MYKVLPRCTCVYCLNAYCSEKSKDGTEYLRNEITDGYEPPFRYQKLSLGLQE